MGQQIPLNESRQLVDNLHAVGLGSRHEKLEIEQHSCQGKGVEVLQPRSGETSSVPSTSPALTLLRPGGRQVTSVEKVESDWRWDGGAAVLVVT